MNEATKELLETIFEVCLTGEAEEVFPLFEFPVSNDGDYDLNSTGTENLISSLIVTARMASESEGESEDFQWLIEVGSAIRSHYAGTTALEVAVVASAYMFSWALQIITMPDEATAEDSPPKVSDMLAAIGEANISPGFGDALAIVASGRTSCWPLETGYRDWGRSLDDDIGRMLNHLIEHSPTGNVTEMEAVINCRCPGTGVNTLTSLSVLAAHAGMVDTIADSISKTYGDANSALEITFKETAQIATQVERVLELTNKDEKRQKQRVQDKGKAVVHLNNGSWDYPGPLCNTHKGRTVVTLDSDKERWCQKCREMHDMHHRAMFGQDAIEVNT
ncbi:MAG: hypothetical protein OXI25_05925 [Chloroflexota bacterium]|nr:hypothetical protein [Chloroflexota bacterium]